MARGAATRARGEVGFLFRASVDFYFAGEKEIPTRSGPAAGAKKKPPLAPSASQPGLAGASGDFFLSEAEKESTLASGQPR